MSKVRGLCNECQERPVSGDRVRCSRCNQRHLTDQIRSQPGFTPTYCACGCGKETLVYTTNNSKRGWRKGQSAKFVHGHQRKARPAISELELAWLAGLLEGEGCFGITRRRVVLKSKPAYTYNGITISVGMSDEDVIARVAAMVGTSYNSRKPKVDKATGKRRKPMHFVSVAEPYAAELMIRLFPLMGQRRRARIGACLAAVESRLHLSPDRRAQLNSILGWDHS